MKYIDMFDDMNKNAYFYAKNCCMLKLFKNYLDSNNISIKDEKKITISFEYSNLNYLFVFDESDPFYFRLILPNIMLVQEEQIQEVYHTVNFVNVNYKVAKVAIYDNNVWISIESFVYSKENIDGLFKRSMELLKTINVDFKEQIKNHKYGK